MQLLYQLAAETIFWIVLDLLPFLRCFLLVQARGHMSCTPLHTYQEDLDRLNSDNLY